MRYSFLDVFIENMAAKSDLRLKVWSELTHDHLGTILRTMVGSKLDLATDYLLTSLNFSRAFKIRISSDGEWSKDSVSTDNAISIFMDGSKTKTGTNSGEFSDDLDISFSLTLPNTCTVLQTEIYVINLAARSDW